MTLVDQTARDTGADARNRIVAHENLCAERWRNVGVQIGEVKEAIRFQTRQMWAANGVVVLALLGVIAFLARVAVHAP